MLWQNASAWTVATMTPSVAAAELEALQLTDGGGAFPRLAVGPEVLQPQQLGGALVQEPDVQRVLVPQREVASQRVPQRRAVGDPVAVAAPQGGEPGVEAHRRQRHLVHLDRPGEVAQPPAQGAPEPAQKRDGGIQFGARGSAPATRPR